MASEFQIEIKGLKEVDDKLRAIGAIAGKRIMRQVSFKAMKPMLDQLKGNLATIKNALTSHKTLAANKEIPEGGSGALNESVRMMTIKSDDPQRFTFAISPKFNDRRAIAVAAVHYQRRIRGIFWAHFIEWGFHHWKSGAHVVGRLFFTNAAAARANESIEIFREEIRKTVTRTLARQTTVVPPDAPE